MRIHVDEDEPSPAAYLDLVQADVRVGHRRREVEAVDHLLVGAVELEPPGVVATADLAGGEVPDSGGQPGAPMRTGVVERADAVRPAPSDQDGLITDDVLEEVPGPGYLLLTAGHLPYPGP